MKNKFFDIVEILFDIVGLLAVTLLFAVYMLIDMGILQAPYVGYHDEIFRALIAVSLMLIYIIVFKIKMKIIENKK